MAHYDFKLFEEKLSAAKEWLSREYGGIRTGRAAVAVLDSVLVSAYGSMMSLKQVANLGVEDARTLRVQPFDASLIKDIERGISASNLGLGSSSDGVVVRITFPELTSERRAEFVKIAKGKLEEARATMRVARDEVRKDIQEKERAGDLTEDDRYNLFEDVQKKTDAMNEECEAMFEKKEKEMSA